MKLTKEARKVSRALFRQTLVDGRLDETRARAMVDEIARQRPRGYMSILKNYLRLLKAETSRRHALIESAVPLTPAEAASISNDLRARHGRDLTTDFQVTPDLIGGLRIQIGSDVWDGSIRNRLNRLQEQFSQS